MRVCSESEMNPSGKTSPEHPDFNLTKDPWDEQER